MAALMERLFKEIDGHDGDGALTPEELVELEASLGLPISLEVISFLWEVISTICSLYSGSGGYNPNFQY